MPLKIEMIEIAPFLPPLLVLDDQFVYPIVDIAFKGKTDTPKPDLQKSFVLLKGTLAFQDIFGFNHKVDSEGNEQSSNKRQNKKIKQNPQQVWHNRLKSVFESDYETKRDN